MRNHKHVQKDSELLAAHEKDKLLVDKRKPQTHKFKCTIENCTEVFKEMSKLKVCFQLII